MIEADSNAMDVKRDLLNQRMKERHQQREMEISRNVSSSEKSTEELVLIFYKDLDPEVEEIESMMGKIGLLNEAEVGTELDNIVIKLQKIQDMVSDAGIFLPSYDSKKCQQTLNTLNSTYQELLERVKPKKKFGFKNRKQKSKVPDLSGLSVTDSGDSSAGVRQQASVPVSANLCDVSNLRGQTVRLAGGEVRGKDVAVSGLEDCRLEILGPPLTLHLTNIKRCTVLCGPVSSSVMVDTCSDTRLAVSCQQLRTHSTTDTDIYLHTTARAILEDCRGVRVAPYNWTYPGMDEDYTQSGLDRTINNWQQIGDFNWLSTDKPSPNWSILPETERRANWEETP